MEKNFYYGVAYYPESWKGADFRQAVDTMQEIGFNTVRMGEFAWSDMEKREGEYDFSLFCEVVEYCRQKGIYVVMCTPSACPPAWLAEKDGVLLTNDRGRRLTHGARRNACFSNPAYLSACDAIVGRMAQTFSRYDNVIGWQIDNELYINHGGIGCTCPDCRKGYADFLEEKYGTIENLNDEWDCHVWSMRFDSFSQVQPPNPDIWNHPSAKSVWEEYQNRLVTRFIHRQIDIIRQYTNVPVSTDMMPLLGLSYDDVGQKTDVIQYNHYNDENNLWQHGLWCEYMRCQKDAPFWITETSPNWNGSEYANYGRAQGFSVANTMLSAALGAEMNCYWLWQAHYGGHELMHGSVVDSWGRACANIGEIRRMAVDLRTLSPYLTGTAVRKSEVAVHFTHSAWQIFQAQSVVPGFEYEDAMKNWIYRPLARRHIRADYIGASHALDGYKVLISPFTASLDEYDMASRAADFVRNGGLWIVLPLTDVRTLSGAKYRHAPLGYLEQWADVRLEFTLPRGEKHDMFDSDGKIIRTQDCLYNAFTAGKNAETLATYRCGYLNGYAAMTRTQLGSGYIVLLGAVPAAEDWGAFIQRTLNELGVYQDQAGESVVTVRREGKCDMFCAVQTDNAPGTAVIPYDAKDVLSGRLYRKGETVSIDAFGCLFAERVG